MRRLKRFFTPSKTSPRGGKRGCLCKDRDRYSVECCDGSLQAQGIGRTNSISQFSDDFSNDFLI
jgi:hypothetical protein